MVVGPVLFNNNNNNNSIGNINNRNKIHIKLSPKGRMQNGTGKPMPL